MTVITLSRQYACRAEAVAEQVCNRLGLRVFDKTLMTLVAHEMGLTEAQVVDYSDDNYRLRSFIEALFERPRTVAERTVRANSGRGPDTLDAMVLVESHAVQFVRATIEAAYARGDVLIVGRGGQVILRDKPDVLRVRLVAGLEARTVRLMEAEQMSEGQARSWIAERDKATAGYLRTFYHVDVDDPTLYHMVLNTATLGIERCIEFICLAAQAVTSPAQESA